MSEVESYPKLGPDTELAEQHTKLEGIRAKICKLEEEHSDSLNKLKAQVLVKKTPLFNELREVFKTIPEFWFNALINIPFFGEAEEDDDIAELLKFVSDVEVEYDSNFASGGKMHFYFSENPFFSNQVLTREIYAEEASSSSEFKVKSVQIDWKRGNEIVFDEENINKNNFLVWLQSSSPIDTDYFFMQDFYPEAFEYFREQCATYDDSLDEPSSQGHSEREDNSKRLDQEEEDQPAHKKMKF